MQVFMDYTNLLKYDTYCTHIFPQIATMPKEEVELEPPAAKTKTPAAKKIAPPAASVVPKAEPSAPHKVSKPLPLPPQHRPKPNINNLTLSPADEKKISTMSSLSPVVNKTFSRSLLHSKLD